MPLVRTPIYRAMASPPFAAARDAALAPEAAPEQERDGYLEKLIKYIPGEVGAVFAAIVALAGNASTNPETATYVVRGVFFLFLILTPVYFWLTASKLPPEKQPTMYFYVLSIFAFAIWGLAVSERVRLAFALEVGLAEFLLALGAFLIPLVDELLTRHFALQPQPA
jgi:hypothetical protein